jgi:peptidoglycan/LPS O-acetylase OafA/YrhL
MRGEKSDTTQLVYFENLDGYRGLAAIFILLFHSMFTAFGALWIGVPMFFVLSGFLITRILIQQKNSNNYLKRFYLKRSLRIFPIYYLGLLLSVFWGLLVNADLSKLPVFLVYLQNFTISANLLPDYCNGIMNHTWSLSAEEIFYLLWPLFILITPNKKIKTLVCVIWIVCLACKTILLALFYTVETSQLLQLSLAGNVDGLMAGALLGVFSLKDEFQDQKKFPRKSFALAFLFFVLVLAGNYFAFTDARSLAILKATLSVAAILVSFYFIWFLTLKNESSFIHKFLQTPFMTFSGRISYGIYLYHALIFGVTASCVFHFKWKLDPVIIFLFEILATYSVAILSWYFIEKPFLSLKNKIPNEN